MLFDTINYVLGVIIKHSNANSERFSKDSDFKIEALEGYPDRIRLYFQIFSNKFDQTRNYEFHKINAD